MFCVLLPTSLNWTLLPEIYHCLRAVGATHWCFKRLLAFRNLWKGQYVGAGESGVLVCFEHAKSFFQILPEYLVTFTCPFCVHFVNMKDDCQYA